MALPIINPARLQRAVADCEARGNFKTLMDLCYRVAQTNWAQQEDLDGDTIHQLILHHKIPVKLVQSTPPKQLPKITSTEGSKPQGPPKALPKIQPKEEPKPATVQPKPQPKPEPVQHKTKEEPKPATVQPKTKEESKPATVQPKPPIESSNDFSEMCKCGHARIYHGKRGPSPTYPGKIACFHDGKSECCHGDYEIPECNCTKFELAVNPKRATTSR